MFPRSRIVSLTAVAGRRATMARPLACRSLSTATATPSSSTNPPPPPSMHQHKQDLLQAALKQVHEHGWTQKAITAAVLDHPRLSLSMAGMITPSELVSYCMDDWNRQLQSKCQQQFADSSSDTELELEFEAIQFRLQCEIPWIQSGRWHEAMAVGLLQQPLRTRQQLHDIIETIAPHATMARQAGLGATYAATELHLLTDTSEQYQATWEFLKQRLDTLDGAAPMMMTMMSMPSMTGGIPAVAANAVAMSLLEGVTSLFLPSSTGVGTKVSDSKK
jgi:ubiquinone biosynthesis protein COQ9